MVIGYGVARRYAQALLDAALAHEALEDLERDLASLESLLRREPAFLRLLQSPRVPDERKEEIITELFRGKTHPLFAELLLLLLEKNRIAALPQLLREFQQLVYQVRNVAKARVVTAVPLPEEMEAPLRRVLERIAGKKVLLEKIVERRLLGGMRVIIENKIIDRSLRSILDQLGETLLAVRVREGI